MYVRCSLYILLLNTIQPHGAWACARVGVRAAATRSNVRPPAIAELHFHLSQTKFLDAMLYTHTRRYTKPSHDVYNNYIRAACFAPETCARLALLYTPVGTLLVVQFCPLY